MNYCPYTDKELPEYETTQEHILPLSLGGINGFEIPVSKDFNSKVGSSIDGKLANDFLIMLRRNKLNVKGHSNKRPVFRAKNAMNLDTGTPLQVRLNEFQSEMAVWNPIQKRLLEKSEHPHKLHFQTQMDTDIDIQFVAKTALSAGYFMYGEIFRQNVKHEELRLIMSTPLSKMGNEIYSIETTADGRFSADNNKMLQILRACCTGVKHRSIVGVVPSNTSISVFVGVLGYYIGMVNVPANTDKFPNYGAYNWGHVVYVQNKKLIRLSFAKLLDKMRGAV
jgi:hypothetical protein